MGEPVRPGWPALEGYVELLIIVAFLVEFIIDARVLHYRDE